MPSASTSRTFRFFKRFAPWKTHPNLIANFSVIGATSTDFDKECALKFILSMKEKYYYIKTNPITNEHEKHVKQHIEFLKAFRKSSNDTFMLERCNTLIKLFRDLLP